MATAATGGGDEAVEREAAVMAEAAMVLVARARR